MRFITQLGDGKGFYGEDNDRRDLPWCNAVKHPKSSRNHLLSQVSVQSQSGFRIWFLWTQDGGGGGGATAFFPHFSFANSSRHSLANVANFLHPLVTVWLPNSILFENTNTKLKDCVIWNNVQSTCHDLFIQICDFIITSDNSNQLKNTFCLQCWHLQ